MALSRDDAIRILRALGLKAGDEPPPAMHRHRRDQVVRCNAVIEAADAAEAAAKAEAEAAAKAAPKAKPKRRRKPAKTE